MKNIISTWICIDAPSEGSFFPSSKGNSSTVKIQQVYWKCVCCFFTTAKLYHPNATFILFSNTLHVPEVEGVSVKKVLEKLGVEMHLVPAVYITPTGYWHQWKNQFYEFSILKYICGKSEFQNNDRFLMLDADCLITRPLDLLFDTISDQQCIGYLIDYDPQVQINGLSRKQMREIFSELAHEELINLPDYYGGEIYASTIAAMKLIMKDFDALWETLLLRNKHGQDKLTEEAHVLSYLYYKHQFTGYRANDFIKRMWTDPTTYRNVKRSDVLLDIWHLPAEKTKGFQQYFELLMKKKFTLAQTDAYQISRRLQLIFLIPFIPISRRPYYFSKGIIKKMLSKL